VPLRGHPGLEVIRGHHALKAMMLGELGVLDELVGVKLLERS
jgi:hypothetical protein